MKWLHFFSNFKGRIGRETFWLSSIAVAAVEFIAVSIAAVLTVEWITDAVLVACLYPQLVIDVKRGHDRNIPMWPIGVFYAAAIARAILVRFGWLVTLPNQNMFSARSLASFVATMLLGIVAIALVVELGFRKGTPGSNRYEPNPLSNA
jgi:uncharacterized membrane protein YhaH (DUF805 family)